MSAGYANPVLVETDWLAERLEEPGLQVFEVSEDESLYAAGHIPGAISLSWTKDLRHPVVRDFIDHEAFAALMSRHGVTPETTLILYGDNSNWFAAYAFWLFRMLGHENLRLLNGGRAKWEAEGRLLTTAVPAPAPSVYPPPHRTDSIRALGGYINSRLGQADLALVDVRSPEEYKGLRLTPPHLPNEGAQVPGRIPGAANIPWGENVRPDGTFKPADELRALYEGRGITPDKEIITYCRIGERASVSWFALQELLGYPKVRNYDGSWTEWGSMVGVPVEREATPQELEAGAADAGAAGGCAAG